MSGPSLNPIRNLHDFIDDLPPSVRADIDAVSRYRSVVAGARILRRGSLPRDVFQVQAGRVKYCSWDHEGREEVLTYMQQGDWIGLSELSTDLPASWDVVTLSPVTVRVVSRRQFHDLLDAHPALSKALLRVFALRFSLHRLFGLDHSALTLKQRLIKMLYFLSFSHEKAATDAQPIDLKLSQEELGKVVGASRQKLNPALKALQHEGLLTVRIGGVTLHSRARVVERYGHLLGLPTPDKA